MKLTEDCVWWQALVVLMLTCGFYYQGMRNLTFKLQEFKFPCTTLLLN